MDIQTIAELVKEINLPQTIAMSAVIGIYYKMLGDSLGKKIDKILRK